MGKHTSKSVTKSQEMAPIWQLEVLEPRLLLSADVMPGVHVLEGSIDQAGEQDTFEFVLDKQSRFLFDGIQGTKINWYLHNQTNQEVFHSRQLIDSGDPFLNLNAGKYKLTVDGNNQSTGTYRFRLFGEESAIPLVLNEQTKGQLSQSTQAMLYRFSLNQGDRIYIQNQMLETSAMWSLFDSKGKMIVSQQYFNWASDAITATESGEYWLSIEGLQSSNTTEYAFTVFRQAKHTEALLFGQETYISLVPGSQFAYTFELPQEETVGLDWLKKANYSVRWRIVNQENITFMSGDARQNLLSTVQLARGHYTLYIENTQNYVGEIAFRTLRTQNVQELTWKNQQANIQNQDGAQVYRFYAESGHQLSIITPMKNGGQWILTNSYGRQLHAGSLSDHVQTINIEQGGVYYLWLNPNLPNLEQSGIQDIHLSLFVPQIAINHVLDNKNINYLKSSSKNIGEEIIFDLVVSEADVWYFEPQTLPSGSEWILQDENKQVLFAGAVIDTPIQKRLQYLSKGQYRLIIRSKQLESIGNIQIVIKSGRVWEVLPKEKSITLPFSPIAKTYLYRIPSHQHETIEMAMSMATQAYVFDAFGRSMNPAIQIHSPISKTISLNKGWVQGDVYVLLTVPSEQDAHLFLQQTAKIVNPIASENILPNQFIYQNVGQVETNKNYSFELTESGLVFIKFYETNASTWTLIGPRGKEYSGYMNSEWVHVLPQGRYVLTLNQVTGTQSFVIGTENHAQLLTLNEVISSELTADEIMHFYHFNLEKQQDAWLHVLNGMGSGIHYVIYDSSGRRIISPKEMRSNDFYKQLGQEGHYILVMWRQNASTQNQIIPLRFEWLSVPKSDTLSLIPNTQQSGKLAGNNHFYDYAFTLNSATEIYLQALEAQGIQFYIYDKQGKYYADLDNSEQYAYVLGKGEYYIRVQYSHWKSVASIQPYTFSTRFITSNSSTILPANTIQTLDLTTYSTNKQRHIELQANTRYWIGSNTKLNNYQRINAYIFDINGLKVAEHTFNGEAWSNHQHGFIFTPSYTGRYTIIFIAEQNGQYTPESVNIILQKENRQIFDYSLGDRIESNLSHLKDSAVYSFSLPEKKKLWLNFTGQGYQVELIRQSDQKIVFNRQLNTDNVGHLIDLESGNYQIRLVPVVSSYKAFSFQLQDYLDLPEISFSQKIQKNLSKTHHTQAWRLSGSADKALLVDIRSNHTQYWSILDMSGNVIETGIAYGHYNDNAKKVVLPLDGDYLLQTHGTWNDNQAGTISVFVNYAQTIVSNLALNSRTQGQIEAGGDIHQYVLELSEAQTIILTNYNSQQSIRMLDESRNHLKTIYAHQNVIKHLPAGKYTFLLCTRQKISTNQFSWVWGLKN